MEEGNESALSLLAIQRTSARCRHPTRAVDKRELLFGHHQSNRGLDPPRGYVEFARRAEENVVSGALTPVPALNEAD